MIGLGSQIILLRLRLRVMLGQYAHLNLPLLHPWLSATQHTKTMSYYPSSPFLIIIQDPHYKIAILSLTRRITNIPFPDMYFFFKT